MSRETFMEEALGFTYMNPMMPIERVWKDIVAFELRLMRDDIYLFSLRSFFEGRGNGTLALEWLCSLADKHEVTLRLSAEAFGSCRLSTTELVHWYRRRGFSTEGQRDDDGQRMVRKWRPIKQRQHSAPCGTLSVTDGNAPS